MLQRWITLLIVGACRAEPQPVVETACADCGESADSRVAKGDGAADASTAPDPAADVTESDVATGNGTPDVADAGVEAPSPLPACFTESAPVVLSGAGVPYGEVGVDGARGWFLVDWASTFTTIDVFGFTTPPQALPNGRFPAFEWFGSWGDVTLVTQDHSGIPSAVRQAGILGTDFLSKHAYLLDFEAGVVHRASAPCELSADRWARLDATGTFSTSLAALPPGQPNVPAVPVRLAGATARAQLDTGFDDLAVPYSVNINAAFFDQLDPSALTRDPSLDLWLTTCAGVAEPVEAWRASGPLELLADDGTAAVTVTAPIIFVKRTPAVAWHCGGIGTWSMPAAQVGATVIREAVRVLFDPHTSSVYVPRGPLP